MAEEKQSDSENEGAFERESYSEPAFPAQDDGHWYMGMSRRDYFAAQAMIGLLARTQDPTPDPKRVAEQAFELADFMVEEAQG